MGAVEKKGHGAFIWLMAVLLIGIGAGVILSIFDQIHGFGFGFGFGRQLPFNLLEPVLTLNAILSTTSIALLVALLIVYVRLYSETRANFSLGLVIVLCELLLNSLISHPLLLVRAGPIPLGPREFLSTAEIFLVVAYAVFLYLSLE